MRIVLMDEKYSRMINNKFITVSSFFTESKNTTGNMTNITLLLNFAKMWNNELL
jgi:hypothetical protein